MKFKDFAENEFVVKFRKPEKYRKINPKSNRMKNFKRVRYFSTKIKPEDRHFKNMPKYANGNGKSTFQEWLGIKGGSSGYGKAANGKWYGWSHRAVFGFKAGDKITGDNLGKKVTYANYTQADVDAAEAIEASGEVTVIPTVGETNFDAATYEDDFTIKDEDHAQEVAKRFHDNVV
jgi:hypothetical protein